MNEPSPQSAPPLAFPIVNVITMMGAHVCVMSAEGEIIAHPIGDRFDIAPLIKTAPSLVCHAPWMSSKLNLGTYPAFDVLELFAFAYPAQFVTPTLHGIAQFLSHPMPDDYEDAPFLLIELAQSILSSLQNLPDKDKAQCITIAQSMGRGGEGWAWAPYVLEALGTAYDPRLPTNPQRDMDVFEALPEWAEDAPLPPNKFDLVSGDETRDHLKTILQRREFAGRKTEIRAQQANYSTRITDHLAPKSQDDSPHLLIAQAGTGIGKTYGYLAPAQLWAQKNEGRITVSTYTKNLQRQIEQDLDTLYPDNEDRKRKTVIQKGRENYLCLLNLQDMIASSALAQSSRNLIAAGLMARWAMHSNDGDLSGNSFPGWLSGILGLSNTLGLADRRGECIYAACDHYHKCFIEGMNRKAKRAEIVINNHALTMIRAATESSDAVTPFIIFDEAHHLFHAADSAYGANLTGLETADLRRWLVGPEDERRKGQGVSRGRGIRKRLEGLVDEDSPAFNDIGKILVAAKESLPGPGWRKRVFTADPFGQLEKLLSALSAHTQTRTNGQNTPYSIECDTTPITDDIIEHATNTRAALNKLRTPLQDLSENLKAILEDKADTLDKDTMARLDNLSASIERRSTLMLAAWISMLDGVIDASIKRDDHVDWFEITRIDGKNYDVGMFRRYKNPMEPFGNSIRHQTHGIVMTSATIRAQKGDTEHNWVEAEQTLGASHITSLAPTKIDLPSPFEYEKQSKIFIITDVDKNNTMQIANAMKTIFEASKGGGLGLFTSIQRLRQTYKSIADALERQSIPLYAQHENNIDVGTLTDMFRDDEHSCLLGTDAMRDGIDVSGKSLRCMVFDRVPWPRPTILHRERRNIFGGRAYDENLTRLKLKQAYGRLIRSENDHGVFVMLDGSTPTRLLDAFPEGVEIERLPLKDAIKSIKNFM
jgi:ATP-dependent DNA helicase DinG